jgi:hypothetical protein
MCKRILYQIRNVDAMRMNVFGVLENSTTAISSAKII